MRTQRSHGRLSEYLRHNALALVALFFALSGGIAWATHPGGREHDQLGATSSTAR